MPALRPRPAEPELTALLEMEAAARLGDDTYTSAGKKDAGAEEDEDETEELVDGDSEGQPANAAEPEGGSTISFVA